MPPKIILIAAVAKNGVIGNKNGLPWYIPEDLRRFKNLTDGKTVMMGLRTFDSIIERNGKPLPNRKNIVLSKKEGIVFPDGVIVSNDLSSILKELNDPEVYVIGGGEIFRQTIDSANKLHITHIHEDVDGDVYFPEINPTKWKKIFEQPHGKFSFVDYIRI